MRRGIGVCIVKPGAKITGPLKAGGQIPFFRFGVKILKLLLLRGLDLGHLGLHLLDLFAHGIDLGLHVRCGICCGSHGRHGQKTGQR